MESASKLLKNTLILAASTIILRLSALFFQSYLASSIGAQQLGLFGIISSVGTVFATISISGIRFSVTRLVAEEESRGNSNPRSLMRCAFLYACVFGTFSGTAMFFGADLLSRHWVMDSSVADAIRIMAISMPLIALGSVAEGFFTAKQKIFRLVVVELGAQILRIVFVIFAFSKGVRTDVAEILSFGMLIAEGSLAVGMLILYFAETVKKKENCPTDKNFRRLGKTALPLAVSAYMRTGLSSLGQIIIPHGLKKSGMKSAAAFSTYGVITQMALPVVMFPAALLGALGEILVPRLTQSQVQGKKIGVSYIANRALRIGVVFSLGVAGVMYFYSDLLGKTVYNSIEAGFYIKIFAPIVPIIYIDSVTDGCLKGLGQQVYSMIYNVLEGIMNVTLLLLLLPRVAIVGYIAVMYIKEVFNAFLSLRRLSKVTSVDFKSMGLLKTLLCTVAAGIFCNIAFPSASVFVKIIAYCVFYLSLLYVASAVSRDDIKWVLHICRENNAKKPVPGVDKMASWR
ncbi:MAG: hypothetical protein E7406_04450 [Ruminococcaceae bacterium]|nr:hypothetical protein [Oscillospiraceae bacterium]